MSRLVDQIWPQRLNEGLSEVLWHVTPISNGLSILRSGELRGTPLDGTVGEGLISKVDMTFAVYDMIDMLGIDEEKFRRYRMISFARSLTSRYVKYLSGESGKALFLEMDGRKLQNLGRGFSYVELKDEAEDRLLLAPNRHVKPIERFCVGVHMVHAPDRILKHWDGTEVMDPKNSGLARRAKNLAEERGIPFYLHKGFPLNKRTAYSEEDVKELLKPSDLPDFAKRPRHA